jgi:hypothetical protein
MALNLEKLLKTWRPHSPGKVQRDSGYSLFSAETGKPIARLRPTGRADEVEILWWRGDRWGRIGDFGGSILPLDEALDYIADEPLFW